jgi:hypothetical protein
MRFSRKERLEARKLARLLSNRFERQQVGFEVIALPGDQILRYRKDGKAPDFEILKEAEGFKPNQLIVVLPRSRWR